MIALLSENAFSFQLWHEGCERDQCLEGHFGEDSELCGSPKEMDGEQGTPEQL